ncbi:MAG: hypothetical protein KKG28_03105, partial [Alphaproteobacteria bacterium]|nr:hypothetical protein [Alphaproteobacteria bacterium]
MRVLILAAGAAFTLAACQPAADPQPVDAEATAEVTPTAPVEAVPAAAAEEAASPPAAAVEAAPSARAPAPR